MGLCMVLAIAGCGKKSISNDVITIKQYKGLEVEKVEEQKVTDEDVENSIKTTMDTFAVTTDITDRAVQDGDIVKLDYAGKVDGVAFEGGTATGQSLTIGSGSFIPGFEDQVIGHNIGETFDINVTFPKTYSNSPELAGKDAVFTITIHGIQVRTIPELTVDMLEKIGTEAKTIEDYKKEVKEDLKKSNKEAAKSELESKVWQALIEQCEIEKYPEDKYDEVVANIESQFGYMAQMYGMEVDDLVKEYYGITKDEMAKNLIKQELAVELIAEEEDLTVSKKEYKEGVKKYAEQYGYEVDEFEEMAGKENIEATLVQEKVGKFLVDNCEQVEKKAEK